ncbi:MAG: glutathione S-transferase family protein [Usitatibacteraceae bacterium]
MTKPFGRPRHGFRIGEYMGLTLYYHPLASYCQKVLIALYENDISFDARIVDLGDAKDRSALQARWPLCKFPVIHDHERERDVPESSIIIEYLDQFFASKRKLIPDSLDEALHVRLWDRIFDNYVQGPMQEIVGDHLRNANGDLTTARATLETAYGLIDEQAKAGGWVASADFSMADCAAAPALFYASTIQSFPTNCTHLSAYFERLMERESVRRVLDEAKPYFSMYPFSSRIPARFR